VQNVKEFLLGLKGEADIRSISSEAALVSTQKRPRPADGRTEQPPAPKAADRERKLRCRDNLLLVANKDFSKALEVYDAAQKAFLAQSAEEKDAADAQKRLSVCCRALGTGSASNVCT
jgi:hypothetical protein